MGKTIEESLPKTPQEAPRILDAGWQVNGVVVLKTTERQFNIPPEVTR